MVRLRRADRVAALLLVSVSLSGAASAQDNYWKGGSSFWDLGANWSLGSPLTGQRLFIGYSPYAFSGGTTFRTGNVSVASLFSKNALSVTGGSFSLTSTSETSTLDAALNVSGGTFGGAANVTVAGLTTLTGGVLGGSGKTTANGGVTISAGTVRIADARTLENKGALTWSGGTVNVDSGATVSNVNGSTFAANAAATWTGGSLANAGNLTHSANTTIFSGVALTNTGMIESSGGELRFVSPTAFFNAGTIKASGSGKVTFQGGTYDVTGSGLSTAGSGTITFSGATLTGGGFAPWTLPTTAVAGSIRLSGSTLGVTFIKNSDRLGFFGSNTLNGVTGDKGFQFLNGGVQTIQNGFTPGGTVALNYGAQLAFAGDRTLGYSIDIQEAGTNPSAGLLAAAGSKITLSSGGGWTGYGGKINAGGSAFDFRNDAAMDATSVLVVDVAGGTLTNTGTIVGHAQNSDYGGGSVLAFGSGSFVNSGTVRGDGGGVNLTGAAGASFSNTGTIEAIHGGSAGIFKNADAATVQWTNAGTLRADGADSRLFLGGTFTLGALGSVSVTNGASALVYGGTLDNTGKSLTVAAPNAWELSNGGRLLGGALVNSANLGFDNPYTTEVLENVHLDGGLNLGDDGAHVKLVGTTHLNGLTTGTGRIDFADDAILDQDVVGNIGFGSTVNNSTITLAAGKTYQGNLDVNSAYPQVSNVNFVNNGTMRGTASGYIQGTITNHGLLEQTADTLVYYSQKDFLNDGTVRATGTGDIYIGGGGKEFNSGTISASGGGTIRFDGYASGQSLFNTGSIRADGAGSAILFDMGSPFTLASLGNVGATNGGVLSVAGGGQLDLTGGTLSLGSGLLGSWRVEGGGTISNGSIVNSDLLGLSSKLNQQILRDVSVDHGLNVGSGVVSLEGAFRSGGAVVATGEGRVYTSLSRPIDYAIRFDGAANENGEISLNTQAFGAIATIASTGEVSGRNLALEQGNTSLKVLNQGLIQAIGTGGRVEANGSFDNAGTMRATEGGTLRFGDYGTLLNVSGTTLTGGPTAPTRTAGSRCAASTS